MRVLGIDLGTSNSAMACAHDETTSLVAIPQMSSQNQVDQQATLLPSVLYRCDDSEAELLQKDVSQAEIVIGSLARDKAKERPDRAILSAKSWLSAAYVDRLHDILPWGFPEAQKMSPVEVSSRILQHLENAWRQTQDHDVEKTIVTVPASFDETARQLTIKALESTSFPHTALLEEPQAAFYAWLDQNEANWRDQVQPGDVILVCDIGGGTTDMTLVLVQEIDGDIQLERIAVGQHLLLGGDNMDLALAMRLSQDLGSLDHWQMQSLIQSCRVAKEQLWNDDALQEVKVSVASRSSKLFAKTLSTSLTRELLETFILEGFFPKVDAQTHPQKSVQSGLMEMGLRYVQDPAITKHVAQFLTSALTSLKGTKYESALEAHIENGFIAPNAILYNGGVFKASVLRERVNQVVQSWTQQNVAQLVTESLDSAVAYGAAVYGRLSASGQGIRVRAGTSHSYYLGVEAPGMAIPGLKPRLNGVCVVPQGTEEGSSIQDRERLFGLVVGEPVEFQFFQSTERAADELGVVIQDAQQSLEYVGCLAMTIPLADANGREVLPVFMKTFVSELGVLELSLQHVDSERSWKLEFDVRAQP